MTADLEREEKGRLFSPGDRLGWEFRDRLRRWRHFGEPPPSGEPDEELRRGLQREISRRNTAIGWAIAGGVLALGAGAYLLTTPPGFSVVATALATAAIVIALWLVVWRPLWATRREHQAFQALAVARARAADRLHLAEAARRQRADAYNAAEWERVDRLAEWGAVRTPEGTRRLDLYGGSLTSWEGFLTTFGTSAVVSSRRVRVLDLSEALVAGELCRLTTEQGLPVAAQVLPRDAATSDLLSGLYAGQLADVLVESIHGHRPDASREARAVDARILRAICDAIPPDELSLARVHAMLEQAAHGMPGVDVARARALEAHLHPLRELGSAQVQAAGDARLECLMVGDDAEVLVTDLFADLATQWALRGLRGGRGDEPQVLIVAGADRLRQRHLERIADACERRGTKLVCLFRHLRGEAAEHLGSADATVFMRLGNHDEAERAARFIGLGYRFALTRVTQSQGGQAEVSRGESRSESRGTMSTPGVHGGFTRTRERTWGVTRTYAEGTNWHTAATQERVLEFAVEPTALQHLPEYALLLVQRGQVLPAEPGQALTGRAHLHVADCNPDILSLPRVLTDPLPAEPEAEALPEPPHPDGPPP